MKNSAVIAIPSHPKFLSVVRSVTAGMCEICGFNNSDIEDIKLAVDEACSNVIKYAYSGNTDRKIVIAFKASKKKFAVIVDDNGTMHPERLEGRSLDDVKPGGLGIHLMKRAFDVISFDERKKKGNRLRLIRTMKRIKEKHEDRDSGL